MYLKSLYIKNFRNIKEAKLSFSPTLNIIYGDNGHGKTSILEAIYFLTVAKSFRTSQTKDLIHYNANQFQLEAVFEKHGIEQRVAISYCPEKKVFKHNHTLYPSLTALLGLLQGVVMTPDDLMLIKGSPSIRRQFLDIQLAQTDPLYIRYLIRYNQALRQRNHLLRQQQFHNSLILPWEQQLAISGAIIIKKRWQLISHLQKHALPFYLSLSQKKQLLSIKYKTCISKDVSQKDIKTFLIEQYELMRSKEIKRKTTLLGPHKDEVEIALDGHPMRFFASEGEKKSCVAALRLSEWKRIFSLSYVKPLMLIDDVGVSLDETREKKLLKECSDLKQIILTSAKPLSLENKARIFTICDGALS